MTEPKEFKSYRQLRDELAEAIRQGKLDEFIKKTLPDIELKDGGILTPHIVYINGPKVPYNDYYPKTAEDVDNATSISLVFRDSRGGDVRIQVNDDNSAWISNSQGKGGGARVKDGVLNTFKNTLENDDKFARVSVYKSQEPNLKDVGVVLASAEASNAHLNTVAAKTISLA